MRDVLVLLFIFSLYAVFIEYVGQQCDYQMYNIMQNGWIFLWRTWLNVFVLVFYVKVVSVNVWDYQIINFLPEASFGLRVLSLPASVCVSVRPFVRVCGNHLLVRTITHHPFKLGSPNVDQMCKRPWLRSLLFWGVIDFDLQGQI